MEATLGGFVSVDGLDQTDPGDLKQIIAGFTAPDKTICNPIGQWQTANDDLAAPLTALFVCVGIDQIFE
jgi:hypothetical protein